MKKFSTLMALCLALVFTTASIIPSMSVVTKAHSSSLAQLATDAEGAVDSVKTTVTEASDKIAVLVIVLCLIALMFVKDSRKISAIFTTLLIVAGAFLGIQIVTNGWLTTTVIELANKYFPAK